jgi:hypothetical protein
LIISYQGADDGQVVTQALVGETDEKVIGEAVQTVTQAEVLLSAKYGEEQLEAQVVLVLNSPGRQLATQDCVSELITSPPVQLVAQ